MLGIYLLIKQSLYFSVGEIIATNKLNRMIESDKCYRNKRQGSGLQFSLVWLGQPHEKVIFESRLEGGIYLCDFGKSFRRSDSWFT